jgi:signal transduction histidine kinase
MTLMYAPIKRAFGIFPHHIVFWVIVPGLLLSTCGGILTLQLNQEVIQADAMHAADAVAHSLQMRFRNRLNVVQSIRADVLADSNLSEDEFSEFASFLFESTPGFQALQIVDAQNIVRFVFPTMGENRRAIGLDNTNFPNRMEPILRAKETGQPVVTEPIQLIQGFPGMIIYVPIFRGTQYLGQAVGVLRLTEFMEAPRSNVDLGLYDVFIQTPTTVMNLQSSKIYTIDGEEIVSILGATGTQAVVPAPSPDSIAFEKQIQIGDKAWTICIKAKKTHYERGYRQAALVVLVSAFFVLLLALLIEYFARLKREREFALKNQTEIISLLAHQLRMPITQINWLLEAMEKTRSAKERDGMVDDLRLINANNKRLIDNLLSLSRIQRGVLTIDPQDVRLKDVVRDAVSTLGGLADDRHITLDVKRGMDALIHADPVKAPEAIRNIVDNAIKYSPEKTTITLDLDPRAPSDRVVLRVTDQGSGIPERLRPIIFEQSTLSKDKSHEHAGAGLGLYLTKKFLRMMGGDVWFESSDRGTTFYVAFRKVL